MRVLFDGMPDSIRREIDHYNLDLRPVGNDKGTFDAAHLFVTDAVDLTEKIRTLRQSMDRNGQIWVSWPKKGSGQETALDQVAVQRIGIAVGLVDIKKCAVDDVWSGLKFVIPKADR